VAGTDHTRHMTRWTRLNPATDHPFWVAIQITFGLIAVIVPVWFIDGGKGLPRLAPFAALAVPAAGVFLETLTRAWKAKPVG
jgi:hypothetical protein